MFLLEHDKLKVKEKKHASYVAPKVPKNALQNPKVPRYHPRGQIMLANHTLKILCSRSATASDIEVREEVQNHMYL
jgi:hypothetical protein